MAKTENEAPAEAPVETPVEELPVIAPRVNPDQSEAAIVSRPQARQEVDPNAYVAKEGETLKVVEIDGRLRKVAEKLVNGRTITNYIDCYSGTRFAAHPTDHVLDVIYIHEYVIDRDEHIAR